MPCAAWSSRPMAEMAGRKGVRTSVPLVVGADMVPTNRMVHTAMPKGAKIHTVATDTMAADTATGHMPTRTVPSRCAVPSTPSIPAVGADG